MRFWVLFIGLVLTRLPVAGAAAAPVNRLGPYNLNLELSEWEVDESRAVNHELQLSLPGIGGRISIIPEFLSSHEISDNIRKMLEDSHHLWQETFQREHKDVKVRESEFVAEENKPVLSVTLAYEKDGRNHILKRIYQWIPVHGMILVSEAVSEETEWNVTHEQFSRVIGSVEADAGYEVSPCVKVFFLGRRFLQVRSALLNTKDYAGFRALVGRYKKDQMQELESHQHHQWAHYVMLAYLEGFNERAIYLGPGADLKRAESFLQSARDVYPDPARRDAISLKNLPELFQPAEHL